MSDEDLDEEELRARYEYEIHVTEADESVVYYANSIQMNDGPFVTFDPRHRVGLRSNTALSGLTLTFPSHRIEIIRHFKANSENTVSHV